MINPYTAPMLALIPRPRGYRPPTPAPVRKLDPYERGKMVRAVFRKDQFDINCEFADRPELCRPLPNPEGPVMILPTPLEPAIVYPGEDV